MLLVMSVVKSRLDHPSRGKDNVPINLHQLELFRVVAERGSLSLASRELAMRQPSLSMQIHRLEKALGLVLLRRSGRGVTPTPSGKEVYKLAVQLLRESAAVQRRIEVLRAGQAGSLRVGAGHTGSLYFLLELVEAFSAAYPETRVDIEVGQMAAMLPKLHSGVLDAVVKFGSMPSGVTASVLLEDHFMVICSPRHPAASNRCLTPEEFRAQPFFAPDDGLQPPNWIDPWLVQHNLLPDVVQRLPSIDAVKRFVEAGRGLTILSMTTAKRELEASLLVAVPMKHFPFKRPLLLLARPGEQLPLTERFRQFAHKFAVQGQIHP
jgi:DNA-binding transcriptional LysR family regulator